jgi:hypothetical protein
MLASLIALGALMPVEPGLHYTEGVMGPEAAPFPPYVLIARNGSAVDLTWDHVIEAKYYEVYRGAAPYFDPALGQGNRIKDVNCIWCGNGTILVAQDTGIDEYAGDGVVPMVQVVGDVANNYFWAVRSRNEANEVSGIQNRVGEFDFRLVAGN